MASKDRRRSDRVEEDKSWGLSTWSVLDWPISSVGAGGR